MALSHQFFPGMLYIYFAGCSYAVFTIFGQIVRLLLNPEPWFFNPVTLGRSRIPSWLLKVHGAQ